MLSKRLDNIFENFGSNFNSTGKKFLKSLAKDEKEIGYDNLFFKTADKFVVKSVDLWKEIGTLYDLLIYLLGNAKRLLKSAEAQINLFKGINVLEKLIQAWKMTIQIKVKKKKKMFAKQESVLNNVEVLLKKAGDN